MRNITNVSIIQLTILLTFVAKFTNLTPIKIFELKVFFEFCNRFKHDSNRALLENASPNYHYHYQHHQHQHLDQYQLITHPSLKNSSVVSLKLKQLENCVAIIVLTAIVWVVLPDHRERFIRDLKKYITKRSTVHKKC